MKFHRDLSEKLSERYNRLSDAPFKLLTVEATSLVDFIKSVPALRLIIENIENSDSIEPVKWLADNEPWPASEAGRAKIQWHLLQNWAKDEHGAANYGGYLNPGSKKSFEERAATAIQSVVKPLIAFLLEHVGTASDILYLLERYIHRVEWFEKERLYREYESDRGHGEEIYATDLRRFLFEQGIDYPFSQPRSASGEADVVANLGEDDPLVCEIKLYNGESYTKAYLAKGVGQVIAYARSYHKTSGYFVVFNLAAEILDFPTDGIKDEWPPRIEVSGVIIYLVEIRALPRASASKQGPAKVVVLTRDDLLKVIAE
jgi:hypothetical protein